MAFVEKVEELKDFYFVGGHGVKISQGQIRIGDIRGGVTISKLELDAIYRLAFPDRA